MSDHVHGNQDDVPEQPPAPAPWPTLEQVDLVVHNGETLFAVTCAVSETMVGGGAVQDLGFALDTTPGASAVQSEPRPYRIGVGGVGDYGEWITYYLTVRPANVVALLAAGFSWSEKAREAAQPNTLGDEPVEVKKRLLEEYAARQRDYSAEGQQLPRALARLLARWLDAVRQQFGLAEPPR